MQPGLIACNISQLSSTRVDARKSDVLRCKTSRRNRENGSGSLLCRGVLRSIALRVRGPPPFGVQPYEAAPSLIRVQAVLAEPVREDRQCPQKQLLSLFEVPGFREIA